MNNYIFLIYSPGLLTQMSAIYTPKTPNTRADKIREVYGISTTKEVIDRIDKVDASILQRKQEREVRGTVAKKSDSLFNYAICAIIFLGILAAIGIVVYGEYYNYYEDLCDKDATKCYWRTIHCNIKECCIRIEAYKTPDQIIQLDPPCDNLQSFSQ